MDISSLLRLQRGLFYPATQSIYIILSQRTVLCQIVDKPDCFWASQEKSHVRFKHSVSGMSCDLFLYYVIKFYFRILTIEFALSTKTHWNMLLEDWKHSLCLPNLIWLIPFNHRSHVCSRYYSRAERYTVAAYRVSYTNYNTGCGLFGWARCARSR